jgi:TnsA endonuclease N terminal/TnsA endonuclease C terminal
VPRRKRIQEADIRQFLRAGFGSGEGLTYKPWETVHTFSSRGNSHRIHSVKTGRTHHLFSNIERALFLKAEYGESFVDFQEQRAMEREHTLAIAKVLGVRHPVYVGTNVPFVMTLDAVVVRRDASGELYREAYDAKETSALLDARVLDKLSMHRMYCEQRGWKHTIVTNETFPRQDIRNLEWIRAGARKPLEVITVHGLFDDLPARMLADVKEKQPKALVKDYCAAFDEAHGLLPGTALRVMQVLLWQHDLTADLSAGPIHLAPVASLLPANREALRRAA